MLNKIIQFISFLFFGVALWMIIREVDKIGWQYLFNLILSTPTWVIALAGLFVLSDYIALAGYDILSLDYIRQKVPFKTIFKTSSVGFAVSNTVGHAFASGGAIRYLFYTPIGISRANVLALIAFETLTIFMGMGAIYVVATALTPFSHHLIDATHLRTFYIASILIIGAFLIYYFQIVYKKRKLKIGGVELLAPTGKMTLAQLCVGLADNFLVSMVFYCILRYHVDTPFLPVFIIFTVAQITSLISQVPGGLGVLTTMFLLLFPHEVADKAGIIGSLFIYRVVYFFIPLFLACMYLIFYEISVKIKSVAKE